jgi:hypothetical protein
MGIFCDRIAEKRPYCWSALVGAALPESTAIRRTVRNSFSEEKTLYFLPCQEKRLCSPYFIRSRLHSWERGCLRGLRRKPRSRLYYKMRLGSWDTLREKWNEYALECPTSQPSKGRKWYGGQSRWPHLFTKRNPSHWLRQSKVEFLWCPV